MSETKFTPGPWKWWTSNSWNRLKRDERGVTQNVLEPFVSRSDQHPDCSVSEADMALIAAAPDLYEALDMAIAFIAAWSGSYQASSGLRDLHPTHVDALKQAKAALAKARGEQP